MNLNRNLIIAAATFAGTLSRVALGSYTFTPVSDPSAVAGDGGTNAAGFYDGTIVGDYGDATGHHGFVFNGSSFTNFDDPSVIPAPVTNKIYTYATGVSGNTVVGLYSGSGGGYGFTDTSGTFATITDPAVGSLGTYAQAISGTSVVGYILTYNGAQGFTLINGSYAALNDPLAVGVAGNTSTGTFIHGIDGSTIVGSYTSGANNLSNGFVDNAGTFTTITDPLGVDGTVATAVSGGTIAGYYLDSTLIAHGFVDTNGVFTTIDDPAGMGTVIEGISGSTLVGYWGGLNGTSKQSFVAYATVPEPSRAAWLFIPALVMLSRRQYRACPYRACRFSGKRSSPGCELSRL